MLLKALLSIRALQSPMSLIFLIMISWSLYLFQHSSAANSSQSQHTITTIVRFLTPIITLPYASYELWASLVVLRNRDISNKFALKHKSRGFKICRVILEFGLGGLWFLTLIFSLGVGSWSLDGEDRVIPSSGSSSSTSTSNSTSVASVDFGSSSNSDLFQNSLIVPAGGKTPMVIGSVVWIAMICLFALSAVGVLIETVRNWRAAKNNANAVAYDQEMGGIP